ncbi:MAG: hypothetical protein JST55_08765 [Bacteroidetes bacterium]|nr:hypothetical protein [Bacteroidota bacterium]
MPHFLRIIRPLNDWTINEMTEREQELMSDHFLYLEQKFNEGKVLIAGPCEDRSMGVSVWEADTREEAEEMIYSDPAVKAGIISVEIKNYRVTFFRK